MSASKWLLVIPIILVGCSSNPLPSVPPPHPTPLPLASPTSPPVSPTPQPTRLTYTNVFIDLYQISVEIPAGWEIREVDRRPEPEHGRILEHDCANYIITSPDNYVRLSIFPVCGFGEAFPEQCPFGTFIVNQISDDTLVRVFDDEKAIYLYTSAGEAQFSDLTSTQTRFVCMFPAHIDLGPIGGSIELQYLGRLDGLENALAAADRLVNSIWIAGKD